MATFLGGQGSFLDSYLSTQKSTIFAHVGVLIYVFDTQEIDKEWENDLGYFRQCLAALARFSPECVTFVLVHKMVRRWFCDVSPIRSDIYLFIT